MITWDPAIALKEHQPGGPHPIDVVDVLVTAGCGEGFVPKMAARNIPVIRTSETDPVAAARVVFTGEPLPLPEAAAH